MRNDGKLPGLTRMCGSGKLQDMVTSAAVGKFEVPKPPAFVWVHIFQSSVLETISTV